MHFLITAYDGKDEGAPERRAKVRAAHLELVEKLKAEKKILIGAAILDEASQMIGSVMIGNFPSREAMQAQWLDREPYVMGDVWQDVKIEPCRVPDFYLPD